MNRPETNIYAEFGKTLWEHDLTGGLRMLCLGIDTHAITSHHALPLLIRTPVGVVVDDGRYCRLQHCLSPPRGLLPRLGEDLPASGGIRSASTCLACSSVPAATANQPDKAATRFIPTRSPAGRWLSTYRCTSSLIPLPAVPGAVTVEHGDSRSVA